MKTVSVFSSLLLLVAASLYGQTGNITNTLGTGGRFSVKDVSTTFFTLSQASGNIGIGTTSPSAKLHIYNGSVLCSGDTGTTPVSGSGRRLMWIPSKGAFRAGYAHLSFWDDANIGMYSAAMGAYTTASGNFSTAMGSITTASGSHSTAIGYNAVADGNESIAMGSHVTTNMKDGSFILGDNSSSTTNAGNTNINQFMARFNGGYVLYSNTALTTGVYMNGGVNGWTNISDRNKKENFRPIDGEDLLSKIRSMSITEWNYKQSDPSIKYIGPVAQDFYAAFHLGGTDSLGINSISIDGVNMAAVQALEKRTAELKEKSAELEMVKSRVAELERRLERLEKMLTAQHDIAQRVTSASDEKSLQR